jgi:fibronectin type 3 domain-containing protein
MGNLFFNPPEPAGKARLNRVLAAAFVLALTFAGCKQISIPMTPEMDIRKALPSPEISTLIPADRQLTVSWAEVPGATSYEVYYSTENSPKSAPSNIDITELSEAIGGLENGTTYYVWVKAKNDAETSDFSPVITGIPGIPEPALPPAAPGEPSVTPADEQLTVSWTAVPGAQSYEVWYGEGASLNLASKGKENLTDVNTIISDLTNGTTYYVWVKAVNAAGASEPSARAEGTPREAKSVPDAPAIKQVIPGDESLTVNWNTVDDAKSYEVYYGEDNSFDKAKQYSTVMNPMDTITGLNNSIKYYVWVLAINTAGESKPSASAEGTPMKIPDAPAAPNVTSSNKAVELSVTWNAVNNAVSYEVYYSTVNSTSDTKTKSVETTTTSTTITNLDPGTKYYVWMRAINAAGPGPFSPGSEGTTLAAPDRPAAPKLTPADEQLTVSWTPADRATNYEVYYCDKSNPGSAATKHGESTILSVIITGLNNTTNYEVWVKAVNAAGASEPSARAEGTPAEADSVPGIPTNIQITSGSNSLTVNWEPVFGALFYEVYHSVNENENISESSVSTTTWAKSITIDNLVPGTPYYVWVKAANAAGPGAISRTATGTPGNALTAPVITSVVPGLKAFTVSWNKVDEADSYKVYYNTTKQFPGTTELEVSSPKTVTTIGNLISGETYYVWMTAVNNGNQESAPSAKEEVTLDLEAPAPINVTSGDSEFEVTWKGVDKAKDYVVYYSLNKNFSTAWRKPVGGNTTSATITGLANNTIYYVWVTAVNAADKESAQSDSVETDKLLAAPAAPAAVELKAGDGTIAVSWDGVADAVSYIVYYNSTGTDPGTNARGKPVTNNETSTTIQNLINGRKYYVWVRAINENGTESELSAVQEATPLAPPAAPVITSIENGDRKIKVSWSTVADAKSYTVYYNKLGTEPPGEEILHTGPITDTHIEISVLDNGNDYSVWVQAINKNNTPSALSAAHTARPLAPLDPPENVNAVAGDKQFTVSWAAVDGAESYTVYYRTTQNNPDSTPSINAGKATSVTITVLDNGTPYYVWVTAINANGTPSNFSAECTVTPNIKLAAPVITSVKPGIGQIEVSWNAVTEATSYTVYCSGSGKEPPADTDYKVTVPAPATNTTIPGLTNGTDYYVWVTAATDKGIASEFSARWKTKAGIESLTVTGPTKTEYFVGDPFSISGLTVTGKYYDGTMRPLQPVAYTLTWNNAALENGNANITAEPGTKTITVTAKYTDTVNAPNAEFTITVCEIDSIYIISSSAKTVYSRGEGFTADGLVVKGLPSSGGSAMQDISNSEYTTLTWNGAVLAEKSANITAEPGTKTITVTYKDKTSSFNITVSLNPGVAAFQTQLAGLSGGASAANPLSVKPAVTLEFPDAWPDLLYVIAKSTPAKYLALDLSDCGIGKDGVFDPLRDVAEGKELIAALTLPHNTKKIESPFLNFSSLKKISGTLVTEISESAFTGRAGLTEAYFPNLTEIPHGAFRGTALASASFQAATSVGNSAFSMCYALKTVSLPKAASIGNSAFSMCASLETVSLPVAESIGDYDFEYCSALKTVNIPEAATIGVMAFWGCSALTEIAIPETTLIKESAFRDCSSLKKITAEYVKEIKNYAFMNCAALTEVILGATPPTMKTKDQKAEEFVFQFQGAGAAFFYVPYPDTYKNDNAKEKGWGLFEDRIKQQNGS